MEEEVPEKLGALKKVYADIILNTAKEAAARIMVSERKAYRFQQELSTAKQDSLNMLLRLKQITDSKISEVETVSVSQRRRIEELEVQLCKAQNMVTDLRTQLSGVHDELEKTKNKKESAPSRGDLSKYNTSGPRSASTSDTKDTLLVRRNVQPEAFRAEKCYADKPDLDSLIMRSKEPEHYRNGCTQRIRAFDRNLSNGKSPLHAETKNLFSCRKKESFIREEASGVGVAKSFCKDENVGTVNRKLRKLTDLEELSQQDISCENGQSDRFLHKFCSRKKRSRYRTARPISFDDQVMQPSESSLSRCKTHHCEENSTVNPAGDRSRIVEDDAQKAADACSTTSDVNERDARTEPLSVQKFPHEDEESTVKLEFSKHGTEVAERSGVSKCKVNPDNIDIPRVSGITEDKETCEATNPLPAPTRKDMPLKYTFQRKRKKGALICPDENKTLEKETAKEKSEEIENIVPQSQKSCLIDESPRDNRRLVLVARQLISLSEKRWR
ncbi:hypothetical protein MKW94_024276 [Papaver nudicaule]|uniref:Uncharacterized protein n=1 Tax=Papaver nudicaule TaxID=74823 RepID=A0AA41S1L9_PAPNU|nr:hypothetical protein [Papaver nudicaule]